MSLSSLVSTTTEFIQYEGSLTQPSCQESVTWIIPNKPVIISSELLNLLSQLMQVSVIFLPLFANVALVVVG